MNKEDLIQITNKLYRITLLFPKKEPLRYKMRETADDILANFIKSDLNPNNSSLVFHNSLLAESTKIERNENIFFVLKKDLEIIKAYFEIAKWQNWLSYFDILEIEAEYDKIEEFLEAKLTTKSFLIGKEKEIKSEEKEIRTESESEKYSKEENSEKYGKEENKEKIEKEKEEEKVLTPISQIIEDKKKLTKILNSSQKNKSSLNKRKEKIIEILKEKEKVQVWEVNKILSDVSKRTLRRDFAELLNEGLIERIGEKSATFYRLKN